MSDGAHRITRRDMLAAAGRIGLVAAVPAGLAACAGPTGRRGLDELSVALDGETVPFLDLAGPTPASTLTTTDLPIPRRSIPMSSFSSRLDRLKRFDQGGTNRMLRDEMVLAWALLIAEEKSGRTLPPDAMRGGDGRPLDRLSLSPTERRRLTAYLQSEPALESMRRNAALVIRRREDWRDDEPLSEIPIELRS